MDIIDRTLQPLDPNDAKGSFLEIQNYLSRVMETVDFTLSRHQDQLTEVDPDAVAKLQQDFALMRQAFVDLKNAVSAFEEQLDGLSDQVGELSTTVQSHTAELEDHETRIEALENRP